MERPRPILVALVGGSGSGKTWLAGRLAARLPVASLRVSQDDFYRDWHHLSLARRARVNFDHPRAIDWPVVQKVLRALADGRSVSIPSYDFATHARRPDWHLVAPCQVILVEGLWLLRRPAVRRLFHLSIYLDCPVALRRTRRLARDTAGRGRTRASVLRQFREQVTPMHRRWVQPQRHLASWVLRSPVAGRDVNALAAVILASVERQAAGDAASRPGVDRGARAAYFEARCR